MREPTEKIWGVASELSSDLATRRITQATLLESLKRIIVRRPIDRVTKAEFFYYPRRGVQIFSDKLSERIEENGGRVFTGTSAKRINTNGCSVTSVVLSSGETMNLGSDDVLVSTIPKRSLLDVMDVEVPGEVEYCLVNLRERNLLLLYIMLDQDRVMEDSWIFFPEREFLFSRLCEMKNCGPGMAPKGKTFLCCEMTCHGDQQFSRRALEYIEKQVVGSLERIGIVNRENVIDTHYIFLQHAYPIWDRHYDERLAVVLEYLDEFANLFSVGRQGAFVYGGIADCLDIGLVTADFIVSGRDKGEWCGERERFEEYTVVD